MSDSPHVFEATAADFQERVLEASSHVPVLVDFWAGWCAPCQTLMPVLAGLAREYAGAFVLVKVDTDQERDLAAAYGIRSLPTVKLFRNGEVVDEFMGAQPESAVRAILDRHVARASDALRAEARAAHDGGDVDRELALLRQALENDPANDRIHLDLAGALLTAGRPEEAQDVLASLPAGRRGDADVKRLLSRIRFARIASDARPVDELERAISADPGDCAARYELSAVQVMAGEHEAAMDQLLEIVRRDRDFRDDAGRQGLIDIFEILGGGPLVSRYRSRLSSTLH